MPALLDAEAARDVTAFLTSRPITALPNRETDRSGVDAGRGRDLYLSLGCTACHTAESYSLDGVGSKLTVAGLAHYLKDPFRHHPGNRMPSLHLDDAEALQIAAYLAGSAPRSPEQSIPDGNSARGEELIRSRGCLSCHRLEDREAATVPVLPHSVASLSLDAGCLAEDPDPLFPGIAWTGNSGRRFETFSAFKNGSPTSGPAPVYDFYRRVPPASPARPVMSWTTSAAGRRPERRF